MNLAGKYLTSDAARLWSLIVFLVIVFALGGGARDDIRSLILLRPLSILFAAYGLILISRDRLKDIRWPLIGLSLLGAIMLGQLVPLPPSWWAALPGHALHAELLKLAGVSDVWRPVTLSPSATRNSLYSLGVPLAVLVLAGAQSRRRLPTVVIALLLIGLISAVLGLVQTAGPADGPLYFYQITNAGRAVGLFSNVNHQGFFLACIIVLACWFFGSAPPERGGWGRRTFALLVAMMAFIVGLATGTRAGFVLVLLATIAGLLIIALMNRRSFDFRAIGRTRRFRISAILLIALIVLVMCLFGGRIPALTRLAGGSVSQDIRIDLFPIVVGMGWKYFPQGIGFGAFQHVFKVFEPDHLLTPSYLNQAHNDVLQFVVEGGLPAVLLLAGAVAAYAVQLKKRTVAILWAARRSEDWLSIACLIVIGLLGLASLSDYPLRTPALMSFSAVCAVLSIGSRASAVSPESPKRR